MYSDVSKSLDVSLHSFIELARHIRSVLGDNQWNRPIWKVRVLQPDSRIVELDKFEDYILKPVREGFGMDSLFAFDAAMKTAGREGKLALDAIRKEIPDYDKKVSTTESNELDKLKCELAYLKSKIRDVYFDKASIRLDGDNEIRFDELPESN